MKIKMKTDNLSFFDKVFLILGAISMILVLWHVFVPKNLHIDGFWGMPMILCLGLVGFSLSIDINKD